MCARKDKWVVMLVEVDEPRSPFRESIVLIIA